jgi:hypothetical protein
MCHHRRHHSTRPEQRDPWSRPTEAPPPTGPIRVGDADRERVADQLRRHAAAGRLDTDELDERLGRVYAATYGNELQAVLADLPPDSEPARRERDRPHHGPTHAGIAAFPLAVAALVALAALTSTWWLLWLIWPMAIVLGPRRHHRRARA